MNNTDFLRSRLLRNVVDAPVGDKRESLDELRVSEWSDEFEHLMRLRLLMGRFRYSRIRDPSRPGFDAVASALRRLERYRETGNLEFLVDVANLCLVEFETSAHPLKHFEATDDGEHMDLGGNFSPKSPKC